MRKQTVERLRREAADQLIDRLAASTRREGFQVMKGFSS